MERRNVMNKQKAFCLVIDLVIVFALLCALAFNVLAIENSDTPTGIHLTWQESEMTTSITVTWQTSSSSSGNVVAYDTVSRGGNAELYNYHASGESATYEGASGYIHDVELVNLNPNSTYYFVCGGAQGGYSNERNFRTAPTQSSNFRFVVGGDCRSNPAQRDFVSSAMSKFNPDFVLLCGDFVDSGSNQIQWDSFFHGLHSYWIGSNNQTIPIIPCLGNHEENATNYYEQFALPNNEQWYSLNYGDYAHIIVLNSQADPSGEQLDWLENDLAAHENYTWKFVMFHHPLFSPSAHGNWTQGQEYWCPIFDKYGVQAVFTGHNHDYERAKPINYSLSKTYPQNSYSEGIMYVVSGGWGAPLHASDTNALTAYSASVHHFIAIDVLANGTLNFKAIDMQGKIFDEVTLETEVIPEFPACIIILLFLLTTFITVGLRKKRHWQPLASLSINLFEESTIRNHVSTLVPSTKFLEII